MRYPILTGISSFFTGLQVRMREETTSEDSQRSTLRYICSELDRPDLYDVMERLVIVDPPSFAAYLSHYEGELRNPRNRVKKALNIDHDQHAFVSSLAEYRQTTRDETFIALEKDPIFALRIEKIYRDRNINRDKDKGR